MNRCYVTALEDIFKSLLGGDLAMMGKQYE